MKLSKKKQKNFTESFSRFLKSRLDFQHIHKKKITLIAKVFPKLRTSKNVVR